jgi:hypothetical protein
VVVADVSSELVSHLRTKEAHHRESEGQSNDPVAALWKAYRAHDGKAQLFKFLAEHVIEKEVYRLSEVDLMRVEIIDRY